jgi:hypothetical protein
LWDVVKLGEKMADNGKNLPPFAKGNPKQGNKGQGDKKGTVNAPTSKKKGAKDAGPKGKGKDKKK